MPHTLPGAPTGAAEPIAAETPHDDATGKPTPSSHDFLMLSILLIMVALLLVALPVLVFQHWPRPTVEQRNHSSLSAALSAETHLQILGEALPCLAEGETCAQFEESKKYVTSVLGEGGVRFRITNPGEPEERTRTCGWFANLDAKDQSWAWLGGVATSNGAATRFQNVKPVLAPVGFEAASASVTTPGGTPMVVTATFSRGTSVRWERFEVAPLDPQETGFPRSIFCDMLF